MMSNKKLEKLKSWRFQSICVFKLSKIDDFFHYLYFTEGSGSEITDFQFEDQDPDPKLIASDPEPWPSRYGSQYIQNKKYKEVSG